MPRVKRGTIHTKRRRRILRQTKGFSHHRKSHLREARQALFKAGQYAYRDRRKKKAIFRGLWHVQLNAALRPLGLSYSAFAHALRQKQVRLNRKMLAQLAKDYPELFAKVVREVRAS
ncbi:MAG: large subunit ribosomal protein L20 [Parcubacteria group bacterium Gr01-1014_38]|nr:MAG: large subunit ribosomal protein L20 [Parcubacteria group bacterium Gr01-1014_38]